MAVRFAPSPTGVFHVGNLRTAWVSWRLAQDQGLPWIVRFEDIDTARCRLEFQKKQEEDLRNLGLQPDRTDVQSLHRIRHFELFEAARQSGQVYPCHCTRKEVQAAIQHMASAPHATLPVYDGTCRKKPAHHRAGLPTLAWRFRSEESSGQDDFIVARSINKEGAPDPRGFEPSYHWACAIDDWDGGFQWLVRAWDLLESLGPQRQIQGWLRNLEGSTRSFPSVFHTAMVTGPNRLRLEKRTRGVTLGELLDSGMNVPQLLEWFQKTTMGLDRISGPPGLVTGELSREIVFDPQNL